VTQIYDTKTDSWSYGAPFPYEYLSFRFLEGEKAGVTTGVDAPERIYIFAEIHVTVDTGYSVQIYNPENDSWTVGADIPTDRTGFGVAVLDDLFYVIGGGTAYTRFPFDPDPPTLTKYATNECYTPFGYGTIPPVVDIVSPENQMYNVTSVSLNFTVNKEVSWMGYILDCRDNITVSGNTTVMELANGLHNVTVYARDKFDNMGVSENINFVIAVPEPEPEPFPVAPVAAASIAAAVGVGVSLLVYFKKRKH
jgi:hypothetical protein